MIGTALDNAIGVFSPTWALKRFAAREQAKRLQASAGFHESMRKLFSGTKGGYEAGKTDRLKGYISASPHENDVPREQVERLRYRAWNLYRNCPQARKLVSTLNAKVIGRGLNPQSQAVDQKGEPFVDFRRRAREVWTDFCKECDFRGKPGRGGQRFAGLSKTALRGVILSGGILYRFRQPGKVARRRLAIPLQIQLIHVDRLDRDKHGDGWWNGLQLDSQGRVTGYQIKVGGTDVERAEESVFVDAAEMGHLFMDEDIDQLLGAPWVGAAMLTMDDRRNYEYSELIAAEMASCVVGGYKLAAGQTQYGTQAQSNQDLTDADGNPITRLQHGMLLNLGADGEFNIYGQTRPNPNAEGFLNHLVRTEAVSIPGVKTSTLTGDYRQSSFSSERSADNDAWPEIEDEQDWFSLGFCQPIWEECITAGVVVGRFDNISGFSVSDFEARKNEYLNATWQGPVARSINPKDDADASRVRIQNGTSSPQLECAQLGRDWREIPQAVVEYIKYCKELGVPEDIYMQSLGVEQQDQPEVPAEQNQATSNRMAAVYAPPLNRA